MRVTVLRVEVFVGMFGRHRSLFGRELSLGELSCEALIQASVLSAGHSARALRRSLCPDFRPRPVAPVRHTDR